MVEVSMDLANRKTPLTNPNSVRQHVILRVSAPIVLKVLRFRGL